MFFVFCLVFLFLFWFLIQKRSVAHAYWHFVLYGFQQAVATLKQ